MNHTAIKFFLGAIFILAVAGCKKDTPTQVDVGYSYIPGTVGSWVVYDVDSIVFNLFNASIDTHTYQIREIIESTYLDAQDRETMRIERYRRGSTTGSWKIKDVWAANKLDTRYERVEENVRYVKLVFPVNNGQIWDGNSTNVNETWDYVYTDSGVPKTINGSYFASCLTVAQKTYGDGIDTLYFVEMYAKDVGMIYKKAVALNKVNFFAEWDDPTKVNGYHLTMQVNSYGN